MPSIIEIHSLRFGIQCNFPHFCGEERTKEAIEILNQLEEENVNLRNMLKRIQWSNNVSKEFALCPICYGERDKGHDENCELSKLL